MMRLDDERESTNFEDRRGQGGGMGFGGGGGLGGGGMLGFILPLVFSRFGIVGVIVVGGLMLLFGGMGGGGGGLLPSQSSLPGQTFQPGAQVTTGEPAGVRSEADRFVLRVLGTTEETWSAIFAANGQSYTPPTLVLFSGQVRSACGTASSAAGPFYCPGDRKVYLDQSFFDELSRRFGAPGDFAAAYVIAHEVGHHVQTLLGVSSQVRSAQNRAGEAGANALQVRMELQADCFAGVWANKNRDLLDSGDFAEGVRAAQAIGDDTLQRQSTGTVTPDSFTHGSSAQRVAWLRRGFESGSPESCDTFAAGAV